MPPDLYISLYGIIYWPFSANTVLLNYWVYYFLLFIVINLWFRFDWQPCLKQALGEAMSRDDVCQRISIYVSMLSVYIFSISGFLFLHCSLCVLSTTASTSKQRGITHRSVLYMPTSQCIVCIYYWFVFVCWCSSIKRLLYPQHQEYKRHYCM